MHVAGAEGRCVTGTKGTGTGKQSAVYMVLSISAVLHADQSTCLPGADCEQTALTPGWKLALCPSAEPDTGHHKQLSFLHAQACNFVCTLCTRFAKCCWAQALLIPHPNMACACFTADKGKPGTQTAQVADVAGLS